jgi:AmiR/NasT family two-component response regulator
VEGENSHGDVDALRAEITRLLAAALKSDTNHAAEIKHLEEVQAAEIKHLSESQADEIKHLEESQADEIKHLEGVQAAEVTNLNLALASRDLIGQAKGVLMATLRCSADEAFALMVTQSQHENRKIVAVAADITARTQRRRQDSAADTS